MTTHFYLREARSFSKSIKDKVEGSKEEVVLIFTELHFQKFMTTSQKKKSLLGKPE